MSSWLITGGTGSFGKAWTRHLLAQPDVERVAIFSRDEFKHATMRREFDDPRMRFLIGSVESEQRITEAMEGVDYCVHAAALKRVEVCDENPIEATLVNIIGTVNVMRACKAQNVHKAVMLSTDKAAAPFTHYGVTKAAGEKNWLGGNVYTPRQRTRFAATRYGNVLGSRGSVVPVFREQARLGGPLTVTDPNATRFWMRMQDAVDLVQLAFDEMHGGEVFVPKIKSSSVGDLAEAIAPGMAQNVTGLGAWEKVHETLISLEESRHTHDRGTHYVIDPTRESASAAFTYRSDTNPDRATPTELARMIA